MYLFISGTWQLLGLNSAHPVVNDLIPSALLFDPGSLILEPEATYGRPSPEAVEVTSRSLDVTQAAGFFVIIEAEFSAKAGNDRRRPDFESVLVEVLEVRHIPDGDFAQASGLIKEKAFKDVSTRDVLQVAEPVVRLFKGGTISLFRLPDTVIRFSPLTRRVFRMPIIILPPEAWPFVAREYCQDISPIRLLPRYVRCSPGIGKESAMTASDMIEIT